MVCEIFFLSTTNEFLPIPKSPIFQMVHPHSGDFPSTTLMYRSQRKGRREAPQEKMPPRQTELKINLKTI